MSEQKRASLTTICTANGEKKTEVVSKKTTRLTITLPEPNEESYPVFDYEQLCRSDEKKKLQKKNKNKPNGTLFDSEEDDDVRRIARQFEQKYGKTDKKRSRCQTYAELGAGYDETDSFIDNTDAYDEALPEEMQTPFGGFYINSGRLEFKKVEVSDHSDIDEVIARRRKKYNVIDDDEDNEEDKEEGEDDDSENEDETKSSNKTEEPKKEEKLPTTVPQNIVIPEEKPIEQVPVTPAVDEKDETIKIKKRKLHTPEDSVPMKQKKKALTVKALLEEKRVATEPAVPKEQKKPVINNPSVHTSINDVIESVIRGKEDSNSSTSPSKSNSASAPTSETEDSQESKPPSNMQPLPDGLPTDVLEIIFKIKHLAETTSDLTRKVLSDDINIALISLEWKSRDLPSSSKHSVYAHLSSFLPCTKDTLMKRTKKLIVQREEDKMKEPIRKLKAAVDAVMPTLLEKYNKECARLAIEQGQSAAGNDSPSSKVARKKFPWNDELRGYLRETITVQQNCFNILKLRKETSEAYVTKFLNAQIRPLWPPGWMKTSTLLREGRCYPLPSKPKKQSSNGIETLHKNVKSEPRINLPSLPSSTTLTPSNGTTLPTYSRTESNNYQHKLTSAMAGITATPLPSKSGLYESTNLLSKMNSISCSISPPKKAHSPSTSVTISSVKKERFTVEALLKSNMESVHKSELDGKKDSVSVIAVNGTQFKDLPGAKKEDCNSNNSGDKILDLSNCTTKHHSVIKNMQSERTVGTNGESVHSKTSEESKAVNNTPSKSKETMSNLLMSRKQRILQDSLSDSMMKTNTQDVRHEEITANSTDRWKHKKPDSKKKYKPEVTKDPFITPQVSKSLKSPPYIASQSSQEAEQRLSEETATATDILSQIINESLMSNSTMPHQRMYDEEVFGIQMPDERNMKPRTMSREQEAKVTQEVDQVIQDLVELRQMSGGSGETAVDNCKNNYNSNPLGLHHGKNIESEESPKLSPYSSFQDEFFKHLLKKDTQLPPINKPSPLPRHPIGPFENSAYSEDIPNKPTMFNLPLRTNQNLPQHGILPPTSKSIQMNHGHSSSHSMQGHSHRPVYFPQLGFNNDDQHLLGLPNNLQFNWPFPGSNEPSSTQPH